MQPFITPAVYWYSLLHIPPKSDFPGTGDGGNGISPRMKSQAMWIDRVKTDGCESCHQLGDKATREIPASLGAFDNSFDGWFRRIQSGQVGGTMMNTAVQTGAKQLLGNYADWTDRIKAGELPPAPPRPEGKERNVVITEWDWATPKDYFHDEISADRWDPTGNPNGLIYGVHEESTDLLTILDPVKNSFTQVPIPSGPGTPLVEPPAGRDALSPYWGDEAISTARGPPRITRHDGFSEAGFGPRRKARVATITPHTAKRAPILSRRLISRSTPARGRSACTIPRRRNGLSSTPARAAST